MNLPVPANPWLLGEDARRWLAEVAASDEPPHRLASRMRAELSPEQAAEVLDLAELRRRATRKFTAAPRMYFTRRLYEQATDQWVARYKAQRFARMDRCADLCCGVGGDAFALAEVACHLVCCDRSSTAVAFCQENLLATAGSSGEAVEFVCDDAAAVDLADVDAWHIDPDRRPAGRRNTHAELHEPPDTAIDEWLGRNPHVAIKLAPGCHPPTRWSQAGELEWISLAGECKQLVAWHGSLATEPGTRRATVIQASGEQPRVLTTVTGSGQMPIPAGSAVGKYVYEPNAAVLASELTGEVAAKHGLWMFASTTGYLTADTFIDEPGCSAFEVLDVMPLRVKSLAKYLRERSVGQLEIKHRSIDLSPDQLRKELKLKGDESSTLIATRVGEKRIAIIARRREYHQMNDEPHEARL